MKMNYYKQKTMPLVSIIIPCHDSVKYLERSLTSCLNQTYPNIEIFLIENNSSDQTWDLCQKYTNEYQGKVFAYQSRKDGMAGAARNLGIEKSNGDYITFLDDDDYLHLEAIEILLEYTLENNADVTSGKISKNVSLLGISTTKQLFKVMEGVFSVDRFNQLLHNVVGHARLIKKIVITSNNIKYEENLPIGNDLMFFLVLFTCSQKVLNLPSHLPVLYNYEVTTDSSTRNRDKYINSYLLLYTSIFNELELREKSILFKDTILNDPIILQQYKDFIFNNILASITYELKTLHMTDFKSSFISICIENNIYKRLEIYRTENNLNKKYALNLEMNYYKQEIKPLVSIIIPCHNSVKYLERSLTSCLNQTYPNIEVLLIENASSDQTWELCQYYSSKYEGKVFTYQSRKDGFSGAARNLGIDNSKGEYLAFLDDDDYLHLEAIELLLEYCIDWNADISASRFLKKENGKKNITIDIGVAGLYQEDSRLGVGRGTLHGKLYKTSFIKEFNIRFGEERPISQDNHFYFFSNLLASKIAVLPNYLPLLYTYEVQVDSQINTINKNYFSLILSYEDVLKEFDSRVSDSRQKQIILGKAYNTDYEEVVLKKLASFFRKFILGNLNYFEKRMSLEVLKKYELLARERNVDVLIKNFSIKYGLDELDIFTHINKIILSRNLKSKHSIKRNIKHSIKMLLPPIFLTIAKKILGKK